MILLYGTHHMMTREDIESIIKKENPDVIGVELCQTRLNYLVLNPITEEKKEQDNLLGKIVQGLKDRAEKENKKYGEDMISVARYSIDNKIPLELLDMDVNEISFMFSKLPENEKNGFLEELKQLENVSVEESIKEVMNIDDFMNKFKEKYPIGYYLLVKMRDMYIANRILKVSNKNPDKKFLVFLGIGHIKGVQEMLK